MRFTCEKSMLYSALNITGRAVAQKSALSAIEGILCRAGMGISLTGYNMETAITCQVDADVTDAGECIFTDVREFINIIHSLPEGPVTIVVDGNYQVAIRAGVANHNDKALPAEDYPELPDVGDGRSIQIPQKALKELISGTIFAVSENQGRPVHTGVKFEVENDTVSAVAVDGFRLARRTYHLENDTGRKLSFIVPANSLKEVEKILQDSDEDVSFTVGDKHILFHIADATLVCRLLEGDFLDWRRVVPTNCPIQLTANVGDLATAAGLVGIIVSEKNKSPLRCTFMDQEVYMETVTSAKATNTLCPIAGNGKDLKIGFNVRYFMDAVRAIPSEEVMLELTNNTSPIVMTPVDDKHDFIYMILPVRIS